VTFTQNEPFVELNYKIEENGAVVAGIISCLYCWGCLSVSILYVDEHQRGKGYGKLLLRKVEAEAKSQSCPAGR